MDKSQIELFKKLIEARMEMLKYTVDEQREKDMVDKVTELLMEDAECLLSSKQEELNFRSKAIPPQPVTAPVVPYTPTPYIDWSPKQPPHEKWWTEVTCGGTGNTNGDNINNSAKDSLA